MNDCEIQKNDGFFMLSILRTTNFYNLIEFILLTLRGFGQIYNQWSFIWSRMRHTVCLIGIRGWHCLAREFQGVLGHKAIRCTKYDIAALRAPLGIILRIKKIPTGFNDTILSENG